MGDDDKTARRSVLCLRLLGSVVLAGLISASAVAAEHGRGGDLRNAINDQLIAPITQKKPCNGAAGSPAPDGGARYRGFKVSMNLPIAVTPAQRLNGLLERKVIEVRYVGWEMDSWEDESSRATFDRTASGWGIHNGIEFFGGCMQSP